MGNELSASAIGRLKDGWFDEPTAAWRKRDLWAKRCVYIRADGIHLGARLEDEKQCILALIDAMPEGPKEFIGIADGARESVGGIVSMATISCQNSFPV